jgi:hypothetical protein
VNDTGFNFTPVDRPKAIGMFMHGLTKLRTGDDGLLPDHDLADFDTIALLCGVVKTFTAAGHTVEDILLYQLADKTEALLVSAVAPTESDVVGMWWKSRAAVVECQLGAL